MFIIYSKRLIGVSKAKELIYTGRTLDGDQAKQIGLVNESVKQNSEGNAAFKHALDLAEEISRNVVINYFDISFLKFIYFYYFFKRVLLL